MGHPRVATDEMVIAALIKHDGMVALAAKDLKITRQSLHERVNGNKRLQEAILDIDQAIISKAVKSSNRRITKGRDGAHLRWFLDRRGRHLGYGPQLGDAPPPATDPAAEAKRQTVINIMVANLNQMALAVHGVDVSLPVVSPKPTPCKNSRTGRDISRSRGNLA